MGDVTGDSDFTIDANVGCTVICGFTPSFNYRDVALALNAATAPTELEGATTFSFSLKGGGEKDAGIAVYPPSRIVVQVKLEGEEYSMILDTGASAVTVSQAAFSALTKDGRAQLSGSTETTSGASTSSTTRAASVVVGGVELDGVLVSHDPTFDQHLQDTSGDVGVTIDGSLGGSFLHEFYVTVDYAQQQVTLARYSDQSFAIDLAEHVGLLLETATEGANVVYVVGQATGDAASKGVEAGDIVTAIDNYSFASLSPLQISTLLFGQVGTVRRVTFGAAKNNANKTVPILVEENLPLPKG
jgi:hypothetical protein